MPQTPQPPQTPPDPTTLLAIGRLVRHFGVWLVAAVVVSLLPLPWQLATFAFLAGAVVTAVRALRLASRAGLRGGLVPMLVVGLVMAGLLGAGTLGTLTTWSVQRDHQECVAGALTQSAQVRCEREYRDAVSRWADRLGAPDVLGDRG